MCCSDAHVLCMFRGKITNTFHLLFMEGIYGNVSQRPVGGEHVRQEECHYVFSGLCLSVSVSWNFYSAVNNGSISFPPPFRLPSIPARQEIGFAPPLETLYGFAMLLLWDLSPLSPITCQAFCWDKSCDRATLAIDQWGTLGASSWLQEALWPAILYL